MIGFKFRKRRGRNIRLVLKRKRIKATGEDRKGRLVERGRGREAERDKAIQESESLWVSAVVLSK